MTAFSEILHSARDYNSLLSFINKGQFPLGVIGLSSVHKAHYISSLCSDLNRTAVIICESENAASKLRDDLNFFCGGAYVYPERDFHFSSDDVCSREYEQQRLDVLSKLLSGKCKAVLCTAAAFSQFTIPPEELKKRIFTVENGAETSIEKLIKALMAAGYVRSEEVDAPGQFCSRGGILDFFPPDSDEPVRAEFFGDEIDSLARFDIQSQRRTANIDSVSVMPSHEIIFDSDEAAAQKLQDFLAEVKGKGSRKAKDVINADIDKLNVGISLSCEDKYISLCYERSASLFDYVKGSLFFVSESRGVNQSFNSFLKLRGEEIKQLLLSGQLTKGLDTFNLNWNELTEIYSSQDVIFVDSFARGSFDVPVKQLLSVEAETGSAWDGTISHLKDDILPLMEQGFTCVVLAGTEKSAKELADSLEGDGINAIFFQSIPETFSKKSVNVLPGSLSAGFEYAAEKFLLASYRKSASSRTARASAKPKKEKKNMLNLEDISVGDYIVHEQHGIGVFDGIHVMKVEGKLKDYIKIRYKGSDCLYLPVTQLDLLSKYITPGDSDKPVKLNSLSSDEWKRTKSRVRSAVKDIAKELTKLYAKRMNAKGYEFSPDIDMQNDFERRFEFEETEDQLIAINEIKQDMQRPHPMDRLLCGDVGFGKTEVALRAAFKCVADGKQCAVLVPTTILAFQHYQTILKRFDGFPIEVEMLSRFRTAGEREQIKKKLKSGEIDLIVGTHSIIAASVEFKDLGLLIVDEEQRFGVAQKEKLKERFPTVDVLTLSATPIPRTLNMAMTGIRDMSVLEVSPLDRHPVQTYVIEYDLGILAEVMRRELRRGGQVYYLYNKVESIENVAARIQKEIPEAKIGIGHGKMDEDELSGVWRKLIEGEIDILVCTTIIETGVDVPNANTLIIEDADHLGLAQLHQIRGRVGRSSRRAYAYFTYSPSKQLTEIAQRRLSTIKEFTQFGAGFQIAMRDLEIRGAGNILGAKQHGHMEAVGYDMYLKMLSEAIKSQELGVDIPEKKECTIDILIDAHIPETYISSPRNRISMYKRIASIENQTDAMDVLDEFFDRFGDPPSSVKDLIEVALIRNRAQNVGIYKVKQQGDSIVVYLETLSPERTALAMKYLRRRVFFGKNKGEEYMVVKQLNHTSLKTLGDVIKVLEMGIAPPTEKSE